MKRPKKIGIDARFYGKAGPGRYTKNIIKHLEKIDTENKYVIFLRMDSFESYMPQNPNFTKELAEYPWYSWKEQTGFLIKTLGHKLDLLYVPHFNIPIFYPKRIVTAIPDVIMHTFSTEAGTTLWKPYFKFKKFIYKIAFRWAVLKSYKVIVPTQEVFKDFKKLYPYIPDRKFVVATEGIDPDLTSFKIDSPAAILDKYGIKKPFLLYLSSMYEHKKRTKTYTGFQDFT
ncbi:MAG: hypothetical protein KatS3mg101_0349 [Patescibacteria group bacterium]|nr:MAG: hypothetical protein KatS3mg101_0349 [Patescibacteria group bacterium]